MKKTAFGETTTIPDTPAPAPPPSGNQASALPPSANSTPEKSPVVEINDILKSSGLSRELRQQVFQYVNSSRSQKEILALLQATPTSLHHDIAVLRELFFEHPKDLTVHLKDENLVQPASISDHKFRKVRRDGDTETEKDIFHQIARLDFKDVAPEKIQAFSIEKENDGRHGKIYRFTPELAGNKPSSPRQDFENSLNDTLKANLDTFVETTEQVPYNKNFCRHFTNLFTENSLESCKKKLRQVRNIDPHIIREFDILTNGLPLPKTSQSHLAHIQKIVSQSISDPNERSSIVDDIKDFAYETIHRNGKITGGVSEDFVENISLFLDAVKDPHIRAQTLALRKHLFTQSRDLEKLQRHFEDNRPITLDNGSTTPYNAYLCDRLKEAEKQGDVQQIRQNLELLEAHLPEEIIDDKLLSEKPQDERAIEAFKEILKSSGIPKEKQQKHLLWAGFKIQDSSFDLSALVQELRKIPQHIHRTILHSKEMLEGLELDETPPLSPHLSSKLPVIKGDETVEHGENIHKKMQEALRDPEARRSFFDILEKLKPMTPSMAVRIGYPDSVPSHVEATSSDSEMDTTIHGPKGSASVRVGQIPEHLRNLVQAKKPFFVNDVNLTNTLQDLTQIIQPRTIQDLRGGCVRLNCIGASGEEQKFTAHGFPEDIVKKIRTDIDEVGEGKREIKDLPYYAVDFFTNSRQVKGHTLDIFSFDPKKTHYYDELRNGDSFETVRSQSSGEPFALAAFSQVHRSQLPQKFIAFTLSPSGNISSTNKPPLYDGKVENFLYDENSGVGMAHFLYPNNNHVYVFKKELSEQHRKKLAQIAHTARPARPSVFFTPSGEIKSAGPGHVVLHSAGHNGDPTDVKSFPLIPISSVAGFYRITPDTSQSMEKDSDSHMVRQYNKENEVAGTPVNANYYEKWVTVCSLMHNQLRDLTSVTFQPMPEPADARDSTALSRKQESLGNYKSKYTTEQICAPLPEELRLDFQQLAHIPEEKKKPVKIIYNRGLLQVNDKRRLLSNTHHLGEEVGTNLNPNRKDDGQIFTELNKIKDSLVSESGKAFDLKQEISVRRKGCAFEMLQGSGENPLRLLLSDPKSKAYSICQDVWIKNRENLGSPARE